MDNNYYMNKAKELLYKEFNFEPLTESQVGVIANGIQRDGIDEVRNLIKLSIKISKMV